MQACHAGITCSSALQHIGHTSSKTLSYMHRPLDRTSILTPVKCHCMHLAPPYHACPHTNTSSVASPVSPPLNANMHTVVHAPNCVPDHLNGHICPLLLKCNLELIKGGTCKSIHPGLHIAPDVLNGVEVRGAGSPGLQELHREAQGALGWPDSRLATTEIRTVSLCALPIQVGCVVSRCR